MVTPANEVSLFFFVGLAAYVTAPLYLTPYQ